MKLPRFAAILILISLGFFSCNDHKKSELETETQIRDSIPTIESPEYRYVTAVSGLSLRKEPNLQSTKLTVMPLGSRVRLLSSNGKNPLNVGGIDGNMDEVEYNGQKGYAFSGFLSPFLYTGQGANAKEYADELKQSFPEVSYSETIGDSVSKPKKVQILILPTQKWHEAFFTAQQLFGIPYQFAFPNPKGSNNETQHDNNKKKGVLTSELRITRNDNTLQKIVYEYKSNGLGYTVTITKAGDSMKIEKVERINK